MQVLEKYQVAMVAGGKDGSGQDCRNAYSGAMGAMGGLFGESKAGMLGAVAGATVGSVVGGWMGDAFCGNDHGGNNDGGDRGGACRDRSDCGRDND
ncbi:hypothetical protein VA599_13265 [Chromobacterium sp. TRC.1.1.SA]|uniref:Glycine zipper domain-containing protein n=1 Tax=Chromobacterium indicum TaxID=3110228 RepID=A0ABV0CMV2_9NEIS